MALIKCPECGKDVSDKAVTCIHCGYPLSNHLFSEKQKLVDALSKTYTTSIPTSMPTHVEPIRSTSFSLFSVDDNYINIECNKCEKVYKYDRIKFFTESTSEWCISNTPIRCPSCGNAAAAHSRFAAKDYSNYVTKKKTPANDILRCPRCNSSSVAIGQRGFNIWTGFLGSKQTVNRCGKCGHIWKPR